MIRNSKVLFLCSEVKMISKRTNRKMQVFMSFLCLFLGLGIYIIFRPTTLLMFRWADFLGLTGIIGLLRDWMAHFGIYLPKFVIFSLPFALWVLAYLFLISYIWMGEKCLFQQIWFCCIPLVAIVAELAQIKHIIPGSFDVKDLVAIIFATVFGFFMRTLCNRKNEEKG